MKNLSQKALKNLKKSGYSFEEIQRIEKSLQSSKEGKVTPLFDVMKEMYADDEKILC